MVGTQNTCCEVGCRIGKATAFHRTCLVQVKQNFDLKRSELPTVISLTGYNSRCVLMPINGELFREYNDRVDGLWKKICAITQDVRGSLVNKVVNKLPPELRTIIIDELCREKWGGHRNMMVNEAFLKAVNKVLKNRERKQNRQPREIMKKLGSRLSINRTK